MRRLFAFIYLVTAAAHVPFALALQRGLSAVGLAGSAWIAAAIAVLFAVGVRGRMWLVFEDQRLGAWRRWLVEQPYFVHWFATLFATPSFALGVIGWELVAAVGAARGLPSVDLGLLAAGCYAAGLVLGLWGVIIRPRWVRVKTIDIPIEGLGEGFDGYRIVQLSDLHIGSLCPPQRARAWVRRANGLGADLMVLTGDYASGSSRFYAETAEQLARLRAADGVVAVMGNHDYFDDGEPLISQLRAHGIVLLRNARHVLERDGDELILAGVDDVYTARVDVDEALRGWDGHVPLLVLAHNPKLFAELADRGASLVLSGHTHWGQVALPFAPTRGAVVRFGHPHWAGRHQRGAATLYVNPGLGTTGPPIRWGAPPEITVIHLRRS